MKVEQNDDFAFRGLEISLTNVAVKNIGLFSRSCGESKTVCVGLEDSWTPSTRRSDENISQCWNGRRFAQDQILLLLQAVCFLLVDQ